MISVKFMKMKAYNELGQYLGNSFRKEMPKLSENSDSIMKKNLFNRVHKTGLIDFDTREFLCGGCELRNNYLNKLTKDTFVRDSADVKGIL